MASSYGNVFRIIGILWWGTPITGGSPSQRANNGELCCFLWYWPEQTVEQKVKLPMALYAMTILSQYYRDGTMANIYSLSNCIRLRKCLQRLSGRGTFHTNRYLLVVHDERKNFWFCNYACSWDVSAPGPSFKILERTYNKWTSLHQLYTLNDILLGRSVHCNWLYLRCLVPCCGLTTCLLYVSPFLEI